jgi:Glycosyl transferases group 1
VKLAYIGNGEPEFSTENDVRRAFIALGWEVQMLQENRTTWQQVREVALGSDLVLITSTWDDAQPLLQTIETFRLCGLTGIPTATLHLDIFHGSDRGSRNWKCNPMFFSAFVFTADGSHQREWELLGVNHKWLRPAVRHDAVHNGKFRPEFACDVAFVGSNGIGYHQAVWPYRKELLGQLRAICQRNGWRFRNPGGDDPKIDRGEDMNDLYASARVTVGDSLCLEREKTLYCSDRAYEGPGRGGLLIMPQLNFLDEDYAGHLPMYAWGDWEDLERKIRHYLTHEIDNQAVRDETQAIVRDGHTYLNRVKELLQGVGLA